MLHVVLIIFLMSLFYLSIANRMATYITVLASQGVLLFFVAFLELKSINTLNLILILLETVVFKAVAVPVFLRYILKRNNITREAEPFVPNFVSLIITTAIVVITIILSNNMEEAKLDKMFFVVALSTLFTGLYFIASRRKIITHVMGFIILENGVVILSLAVGVEMPMLVNLGILLDIFVTVLVLGIFAIKIGDFFKEAEVDHLNRLKD